MKRTCFSSRKKREHRAGESPTVLPLQSSDPSQTADAQDQESSAPDLLHRLHTSLEKEEYSVLRSLCPPPTARPAACLPPTYRVWSGRPGKYWMVLDFHLPVQPWKDPSQIFGQQGGLEKMAKLALLSEILWHTKHGIKKYSCQAMAQSSLKTRGPHGEKSSCRNEVCRPPKTEKGTSNSLFFLLGFVVCVALASCYSPPGSNYPKKPVPAQSSAV